MSRKRSLQSSQEHEASPSLYGGSTSWIESEDEISKLTRSSISSSTNADASTPVTTRRQSMIMGQSQSSPNTRLSAKRRATPMIPPSDNSSPKRLTRSSTAPEDLDDNDFSFIMKRRLRRSLPLPASTPGSTNPPSPTEDTRMTRTKSLILPNISEDNSKRRSTRTRSSILPETPNSDVNPTDTPRMARGSSRKKSSYVEEKGYYSPEANNRASSPRRPEIGSPKRFAVFVPPSPQRRPNARQSSETPRSPDSKRRRISQSPQTTVPRTPSPKPVLLRKSPLSPQVVIDNSEFRQLIRNNQSPSQPPTSPSRIKYGFSSHVHHGL